MFKRLFIIASLLICTQLDVFSQFYNGMNQTFGKNRVQFNEFFWTYYRFSDYEYHFYPEAKIAADYAAKITPKIVRELEMVLDYSLDDKIYFIVYNKIDHFRQSNVGINDDKLGMSGVSQVSSKKIFLYFDGDYESFESQIKKGLATIMINRMMFGENWKEVLKNSALLSIPDWYTNGLVSYSSKPWDVELDGYLRDGVVSGKFEKFNRLTKYDAEVAGHSLWNYISEVYGPSVIPNVLYMARVSKNIESGFLYVLGVSLYELIDESLLYYKIRYETEDDLSTWPLEEPEQIKSRKNRVYSQFNVNSDGTKGAFVTNKMGKAKAYVLDTEKGKIKKVYKKGYKLDRINDLKNPVLCWHPDGDKLVILREHRGKNYLGIYELESKKTRWREVFKVDKIYDANFSEDGAYLVLQATQKSQSDLYVLKMSSNVIEQITNDVYDEKNPRFIEYGNKIIFSSNRNSDTLTTERAKATYNKSVSSWDVYVYDFAQKSKQLRRLTNTPDENEFDAFQKPGKEYVWRSNNNGVYNRYVAHVDSFIASVDTTIHYGYTTKSNPITNYKRNIIDQDANTGSLYYTQMLLQNGRYRMYKIENLNEYPTVDQQIKLTKYQENKIAQEIFDENLVNETNLVKESQIVYTRVKVFDEQKEESYIDIDDYKFNNELDSTKTDEKEKPTKKRFVTLLTDKDAEEEFEEVKLPQQRNYNLNFTASELRSSVDFEFANQLYQPFNGGPWSKPGMGVVTKVELYDIFEDYKIEGGMRYSLSQGTTEFFASIENRIHRVDKKYSLQRQSIENVSGFNATKVFIHQAKAAFKFPFNEVLSITPTLNIRNDRTIVLSTDRRSLQQPDKFINWAGVKLELTFDNVTEKGVNLYNGARWKMFFERYQEIGKVETDINMVGLDFRNCQKIHRDIIWAFRVAGSSSFGNRKLVYYLGGVDNWATIGSATDENGDDKKFDFDQNIAQNQNYSFQALATNMRGFKQNSRNGNTFAAINNEIRIPIIKYFSKKPIKSEFWGNLQVVGFGDIGTAWTGNNPFSDENAFNTVTTVDGPLTIRLENKKNPIIGSYGFGFRTKIWGYFGRFDYAYGVEDGQVLEPRVHLSLGLDF
tara:strand:- start:2551 stop:5856 length:3306 start_codon:yes stop_codon:yes gene_type:complete